MKVLHVYKDFYPVLGGIENHLQLLSTELARREGIEVGVLVANTGPRTLAESWDGVRLVKAARLATVSSTPISIALFGEIGRRAYDIVHLHFPYPVGELAYLLRGRSRRLVVTYHSDIVRQRLTLWLYRPFLHRLLHRADAVIAGSPNYLETSPYLRRFKEKCTVIPFGIDVAHFQRFADQEAMAQLRGRYPQPLILFVGKFRYYKGLHYLVEAMKDIEKGTLLLVGRGPQEAALRGQVAKAALEQRVIFLGEVGQGLLLALYHTAHLLVLPACQRSEAFGLVQLEAMACGVPVVSTELGTGTSFVNRDGETGLVVPPANPAALAIAIQRILSDEALREGLGRQARERVEEEFTKELMVERTMALYKKLLHEG